MCLLGICLQSHPDFPLIIVNNRDEFHSRKTADPIEGDLIFAKDSKRGGTNIAFHSQNGNLSCLLNMPAPSGHGFLTRGLIALDFIKDPDQTFKRLQSTGGKEYQGFNVIWGNLFTLTPKIFYTDNKSKCQTAFALPDGITSIGNASLHSVYIKCPYACQALRNALKIIPRKQTNDDLTIKEIENVRDCVVNAFGDTSVKQFVLSDIVSEFFSIDPAWNISPALTHTLDFLFYGGIFLSLLFLILFFLFHFPLAFGFVIKSFIVLLCGSLVIGIWYQLVHLRLFKEFPFPPWNLWGTVSQTVVLGTKNKKIYYFYRSVKNPWRLIFNQKDPSAFGPWKLFQYAYK